MKSIRRNKILASIAEDRDEVVDDLIEARNSLLEAADSLIEAYKKLQMFSPGDAGRLKSSVIDLIISGEEDLSLTNEVDKLQQTLQMRSYSYEEDAPSPAPIRKKEEESLVDEKPLIPRSKTTFM